MKTPTGITPYHAKLFAHDLLRIRPSGDVGKLAASLQDAQVDLNPHQVDAALFAFQSPLSKGAILADEVGLGKTIEAGIILSQKWAERKRELLIIAPSNLRKQWSQELADKFFLPSLILESKSFNQEIENGNLNPFNTSEHILICSFQFAKTKESYIQRVSWDLVVIDEAHRLRNVYKPSNKIANAIKKAVADRKKVLLTATPLQNTILELFGLVSIIDDYVFGDLKSFKSQFSRMMDDEDFAELRRRLQPVCRRTLRRQVQGYINYTERRPLVEEFHPSEEENRLYEWVGEYLQRPKLYALPQSQRQLITLILRKLLASSTFAIHGTLDSLVRRLKGLISEQSLEDALAENYDDYDDYKDEWLETEETTEDVETPGMVNEPLSEAEIAAVQREIADLKQYRDLAYSIKRNTKADKLLTALDKAFATLREIGANEKALIFTESRRTQDFLFDLLNAPDSPYHGRVVLFNGTNNDALSKSIYKDWMERYRGTDHVTGSPTSDKRAALVEYFRDTATVMIATEAAAEGINLQFCSLVVNYDLPWNPQRIEQRIGRCHRYGQKHDVVVLNFLNKDNAADQRVYQLLSEKFKLFDGVFGASDEVLGAIGSGIDFEKRIARILLECRSNEEIQLRFNELDEELRPEKIDRYRDTRRKLIENVDQEVIQKLRISFEEAKGYLNRFEQKLWKLTRYFLRDHAEFSGDHYAFTLRRNPFAGEQIHPGPYMILRPEEGQRKSDIPVPHDTNLYRAAHPLAHRILSACMEVETPMAELRFDYTGTETKFSALEPYLGRSGWMQVSKLTITAFEEEDHLLFAAATDAGEAIPSDLVEMFFELPAYAGALALPAEAVVQTLANLSEAAQAGIIADNLQRNNEYFDTEMEKLNHWADDMKQSLQREIEDLDAEIKLRRADARKLFQLEQKVKAQRAIKEMENLRNEKRNRLYAAQDEIDARKETLLDDVEQRLQQRLERNPLFTIRWTIR